MREVARLGFVLLGLHLAFSALLAGASIVQELDPQRGSITFPAASIGAVVMLVFVPGCILATRSQAFAVYLFPAQDSPPTQHDLVKAGLAILGVYLFFQGIAGALSYAVVATLSASFPALAWINIRSVVWSVFQATIGVVLFRYPHVLSSRIGGPRAA